MRGRTLIWATFPGLFRRLGQSWQRHLARCGQRVEYVEGLNAWQQFSSMEEPSVLVVLGSGMGLKGLRESGVQSRWRTVLWNCEPFVPDPESPHFWKTEALRQTGRGFAAIACMNREIEDAVRAEFQGMHTCFIPYMIDPEEILPPAPGNGEKTLPVLQLGRASEHRKAAEKIFIERGLPARFIYDGVYAGEAPELVASATISLNIHSDPARSYFTQHRIFEAWAAGSVVVSEPCDDCAEFGVEPGKHFVAAAAENMPDVCEALLADPDRRNLLIRESQAFLRRRYTTDRWVDRLFELVADGNERWG